MKKTILMLLTLLSVNLTFSQISDSSLCEEITKTYDEFDKATTYSTPLSGTYGSMDCVLMKVVTKTRTDTYLSLESSGSTLNVGETGVKIILSNGQTLSFPSEKIDTKAGGRGWDYTAFIRLTPDKLLLLRKHKIVKWKLFIYENEIKDETAEWFRNWANCMASKK